MICFYISRNNLNLYIKKKYNNYTMVFLNLFYFQPRLVSASHSHFQVVSRTEGLQFVDVICRPSVLDTTWKWLLCRLHNKGFFNHPLMCASSVCIFSSDVSVSRDEGNFSLSGPLDGHWSIFELCDVTTGLVSRPAFGLL